MRMKKKILWLGAAAVVSGAVQARNDPFEPPDPSALATGEAGPALVQIEEQITQLSGRVEALENKLMEIEQHGPARAGNEGEEQSRVLIGISNGEKFYRLGNGRVISVDQTEE